MEPCMGAMPDNDHPKCLGCPGREVCAAATHGWIQEFRKNSGQYPTDLEMQLHHDRQIAKANQNGDVFPFPHFSKKKWVMGVDQGVGKDATTISKCHTNKDGYVDKVQFLSFDLEDDIKQLENEIYKGLRVPKDMLHLQKETPMTIAKYDHKTLVNTYKAMCGMVKDNPMPVGKMTIWDVKVMPSLHNHAPSEQDIAKAHTVVVVQKSRELQPSTWLELTPQGVQIGRPYGFEQPAATAPTEPPPASEPSSKLLEQLVEAATGCKADGYATWEGAVGFAVMRLNEQNARIKALLLNCSNTEYAYRGEQTRANRAADHAGNLSNARDVENRQHNQLVAQLVRENAELKRQLKKR